MPNPLRTERTAAEFCGDIELTDSRAPARTHRPESHEQRGSIFEPLENRRLLASIALSSGTLTLTGDDSVSNNFYVEKSGSSDLSVMLNGLRKTYSASSISKIVMKGGSRGDKMNIQDDINKPAVFYGNGGNDSIHGNNGRDTVYGGSGNDSIKGVAGDDVFYGEDGDDTLDGDGGYDVLDGGAGWDTAYEGEKYVSIEAGHGGSGGTTFQEKSGRVDLEAETASSSSSPIAQNWSTISDSSASGSKAIQALPNQNVNVGDSTKAPRRDFAINFSSTGTYHVWVRMASNSGNDDSIHAGLDGTPRTYGSRGMELSSSQRDGKWRWNNTTASGARVTVNVGSTGVHTFNIWMREDGVKVDRIILTKDSAFNPNGTSNDGGGGGGTTDNNATKPTPKITAVSSLNVMAGMSVHVNALSSSFGVGDMDTARFEWDFGDPNGKRNKVVGWTAAHLYENPGTYTIKLKVWNQSLGYGETTVSVNVANNTRKKIYVSPSGSNNNSGTSSSSPVKTIVRAVELMRANNGNAEILLQRGARHDLASTQSIDRPNVVIGAYGSGSNPVVWWTRGRYDTKSYFLLGYGTNSITVRDLTFDTPYGGDTSAVNMPHALQPAGVNVTIYNNEFRHVGDAVAGNAVPKAVLVLNNKVPSNTMLRRYFAWVEGSDWTIIDNVAPNSTREHIVRIGDAARMNISYNTFSNLDLRSSDPYDYAKGAISIQKGSYAYVGSNVTRGPSGVGPLGGGDGVNDTSSRFKHAVFEANRMYGQFHVHHGSEDVEVRSNILQSDEENLIFSIDGYNSTYNRSVKNLSIVNNTGINMEDNGRFLHVWGPTSGVTVSNNFYYAPKLYAGPYGTAVVKVDASNLNGFAKVDRNVWADADWLDWAGGLMWVGTGTGNSGYLDKGEWLALPQVGEDKFSDQGIDTSTFKPSSGSTAATFGTRVPGVMVDFNGKWRPNQDGRPVGAVTL